MPYVVAGVGVLSPAGVGVDRLWRVVSRGERPHVTAPPEAGGGIWGRIKDDDVATTLPGRRFRRLPRFTRLVLAAAKLALESAGLEFTGAPLGRRTGIFLGTSRGPLEAVEEMSVDLVTGLASEVRATLFQETVYNAAVGRLSIQIGASGPGVAFSSGPACGLQALAAALLALECGRVDRALVGAVETLSPRYRRALSDLGLLAPAFSAPFAARRDGLMISEGAVFVVVESAQDAGERGAEPWVEILAVSEASDAFSSYRNEPAGRGFELALRRVLDRASLRPEQVDLVLAAANGEPELDLAEGRALRTVWGDGDGPAVAALRGTLGDMGTANGLIGVALGGAIFRAGSVPPTRTSRALDPECEPRLARRPSALRAEVILVEESSWGGVNSAALVRRAEVA